MEQLESILSHFERISLRDIDRVQLLHRRDTKYWFHKQKLASVVRAISNDYFLLEIENKVLMRYDNRYYDTSDNRMYLAHHAGKLNRFKVRRRKYVDSDDSFLEVKFKSNKRQTRKSRIAAAFSSNGFLNEEVDFLQQNCPFPSNELAPSLENSFTRFTLVSRNFDERCTIDLNLKFTKDDAVQQMDNLAIVEIKSERKPTNSKLAKALKKERILACGFSKYCMGRVLLDSELKQNRFKKKRLTLTKINST